MNLKRGYSNSGNGGAVANLANAQVAITRATFHGNTAQGTNTGYGSAIASTSGAACFCATTR